MRVFASRVICRCVVIALLGFLVAANTCLVASASVQDDAKSAIADANSELVQSYNAVSAAQKAGANVTNLASVLDDAGEALSGAELNYAQGNFSAANALALYSQDRLTGLVAAANALKSSAAHASYVSLLVSVGSSVGAVAVVLVASGLWVLLKRSNRRERAR